MKKLTPLSCILSLLIIVITSCSMENGTGTPVEISHNPKNLLFLEKSDYSSSRREVFMWFTTPKDFGATSYTLQFSQSNDPYDFQTVTNGEEDLTTESSEASGYSIPIPSPHTDGYFRLRINGGIYDGEYSNIVYTTQCTVNNRISWSLDYSIANTEIVSPRVGFGIVASFPLVDETEGPISDALTYKWFRVNPNDFEDAEEIVGQTDLSYTTQSADVDHYILVIATGNENFPGGFCYAMTDFVVRL